MRFVALVLIMLLSGCIESTLEDGRVFTLQTLDRVEDAGPVYSMKENLSEGPVLVLFIGVGCTGCKDWTDDLREHHQQWMQQDPPLQLVSVERYPAFEDRDDVAAEFGTPESNHYTPWPIVLPSEEDSIQRMIDQVNMSQSVFEYYGLPGTPELFLIDQNGIIQWESTTYYPNENSIETIENEYKKVI
ncbi:MAG: peroxiredoxin family protein [Candidatus Poseidoniaceae archaeon]